MGKRDSYKQAVLQASQRLFLEGYNVGTSGNVSVLIEPPDFGTAGEAGGTEGLGCGPAASQASAGLIAVTPSSRPYLSMVAEDIPVVRFDLTVVEGQYRPSVETGMHVEVYRHRPDVGAVIHTHQRYASVLSVLGRALPVLFGDQAMNLGPGADLVPCFPSGTPTWPPPSGAAPGSSAQCPPPASPPTWPRPARRALLRHSALASHRRPPQRDWT